MYRVQILQLSVAQGWVCCAYCHYDFNALLYLLPEHSSLTDEHTPALSIEHRQPSPLSQRSSTPHDNTASKQVCADSQLLEIFDTKVKGSNVSLQNYLNGLQLFHHDPTPHIRHINLQKHEEGTPKHKHGVYYYIIWSCLNIGMLVLLLTQLIWFNYRDLLYLPMLENTSNKVCEVFSCTNWSKSYTLIELNDVRIIHESNNQIRVQGILLNTHSSSLYLPRLKLSLLKAGEIQSTTILSPQEYLNEKLRGIERIPFDRPFLVNFTIDKSKNDFDDYRLEIFQR